MESSNIDVLVGDLEHLDYFFPEPVGNLISYQLTNVFRGAGIPQIRFFISIATYYRDDNILSVCYDTWCDDRSLQETIVTLRYSNMVMEHNSKMLLPAINLHLVRGFYSRLPVLGDKPGFNPCNRSLLLITALFPLKSHLSMMVTLW